MKNLLIVVMFGRFFGEKNSRASGDCSVRTLVFDLDLFFFFDFEFQFSLILGMLMDTTWWFLPISSNEN